MRYELFVYFGDHGGEPNQRHVATSPFQAVAVGQQFFIAPGQARVIQIVRHQVWEEPGVSTHRVIIVL